MDIVDRLKLANGALLIGGIDYSTTLQHAIDEIERLRRNQRCSALEGEETGAPCNTYKMLEALKDEEIERLTAERDELTNALEYATEKAQTLRAERDALKATLNMVRRTHYECEDRWFSCPKSVEGCSDEGQGDECNCGADRTNAIIDAALRGEGEKK